MDKKFLLNSKIQKETSLLINENLPFFDINQKNITFSLKKIAELALVVVGFPNTDIDTEANTFMGKVRAELVNAETVRRMPATVDVFLLLSRVTNHKLSDTTLNQVEYLWQSYYLVPYERLQHFYCLNQFGVNLNDSRKKLWKYTEVYRHYPILNADYINLYNVTHDIFFYTNMGKTVDMPDKSAIIQRLFESLGFSLKSGHYDLSVELLLCLCFFHKFLTSAELKMYDSLYEVQFTQFYKPLISNNLKSVSFGKYYHYLLVSNMLSSCLEVSI
ncbi:DUF6895 family protein [Levilactobacillus andaensis]|uniref:DUF6895 family protein n=1 Tax=Levilactobacillus andaensis TaxID=2799570 RepID=UPI001943E818|nr:hypothetical protein [Levilactobacillus andaensis]